MIHITNMNHLVGLGRKSMILRFTTFITQSSVGIQLLVQCWYTVLVLVLPRMVFLVATLLSCEYTMVTSVIPCKARETLVSGVIKPPNILLGPITLYTPCIDRCRTVFCQREISFGRTQPRKNKTNKQTPTPVSLAPGAPDSTRRLPVALGYPGLYVPEYCDLFKGARAHFEPRRWHNSS